MKYLNEEEVKLLNEMKDRCLNGGQYKDENAKKKFNMLCHLEDFAVQYYNLQEVIKEAREVINKMIYTGYLVENGATAIQYMPTGKKTEFYPRAKIIDEILSKGENK